MCCGMVQSTTVAARLPCVASGATMCSGDMRLSVSRSARRRARCRRVAVRKALQSPECESNTRTMDPDQAVGTCLRNVVLSPCGPQPRARIIREPLNASDCCLPATKPTAELCDVIVPSEGSARRLYTEEEMMEFVERVLDKQREALDVKLASMTQQFKETLTDVNRKWEKRLDCVNELLQATKSDRHGTGYEKIDEEACEEDDPAVQVTLHCSTPPLAEPRESPVFLFGAQDMIALSSASRHRHMVAETWLQVCDAHEYLSEHDEDSTGDASPEAS